jgi:hypothetical protein
MLLPARGYALISIEKSKEAALTADAWGSGIPPAEVVMSI